MTGHKRKATEADDGAAGEPATSPTKVSKRQPTTDTQDPRSTTDHLQSVGGKKVTSAENEAVGALLRLSEGRGGSGDGDQQAEHPKSLKKQKRTEDGNDDDDEEEEEDDDDDGDDSRSGGEEGRAKPRLELVPEAPNYRRGPQLHCPELYDEIDRARRAGIPVGPNDAVVVRYEPTEGTGVHPAQTPAPERQPNEQREEKQQEEQHVPPRAEQAISRAVTSAPAVVTMMGVSETTFATGPLRHAAEQALPTMAEGALSKVPHPQPTGGLVAAPNDISRMPAQALHPRKTPDAPDFSPLTHTHSRDTGAHTSGGPGEGPGASKRPVQGVNTGQQKFPPRAQVPPAAQAPQRRRPQAGLSSGAPMQPVPLEPAIKFRKRDYDVRRFGQKRLRDAFPTFGCFRRMRTWAGPGRTRVTPPGWPLIFNNLPPNPVLSRPGRRHLVKWTDPSPPMEPQRPGGPQDIPIPSIEGSNAQVVTGRQRGTGNAPPAEPRAPIRTRTATGAAAKAAEGKAAAEKAAAEKAAAAAPKKRASKKKPTAASTRASVESNGSARVTKPKKTTKKAKAAAAPRASGRKATSASTRASEDSNGAVRGTKSKKTTKKPKGAARAPKKMETIVEEDEEEEEEEGEDEEEEEEEEEDEEEEEEVEESSRARKGGKKAPPKKKPARKAPAAKTAAAKAAPAKASGARKGKATAKKAKIRTETTEEEEEEEEAEGVTEETEEETEEETKAKARGKRAAKPPAKSPRKKAAKKK